MSLIRYGFKKVFETNMRTTVSDLNDVYVEKPEEIEPDPVLSLIAWSLCISLGITFWTLISLYAYGII